jgi:hypothetical protein
MGFCILCLKHGNAASSMKLVRRWLFMPLQQDEELFSNKSRRGGAECKDNFPKTTTLKSQKGYDNCVRTCGQVFSRIR